MNNRTAVVSVFVAAIAVGVIISSCGAPATGDQFANADKTHTFRGADRCLSCHDQPTQLQKDRGVTSFVLLTESKTWSEQDKHSLAYKKIAESELGKRICQVLDIELSEHEQNSENARQCLSCHSNWLPGEPRPSTFAEGVTCESCHGPSSMWDGAHSETDWRKKPVIEKEALGMVAVRDPVRRAEQCLSCHIGNVEQGKVITHAMYEAGHPPLPSIEIETFATCMPRHWRYPNEKQEDFQFRAEFLKQHYAGPDPNNQLHASKSVILGGVVAMRESVKLLQAGSSDRGGMRWPEFALFDCYGCHHELNRPSWRQSRSFTGAPGRPQSHSWTTALVWLGILHACDTADQYLEQRKAFQLKFDALRHAVTVQPFGDPKSISEASAELLSRLEGLIEKLQTQSYDQKAVRRALRRLCGFYSSPSASELPDYDSARQIAWAIRILYSDLDPKPSKARQIEEIFNTLTKELKLDLPYGKKREVTEEQMERFKAMADYDPVSFRNHLQRLWQLLKDEN